MDDAFKLKIVYGRFFIYNHRLLHGRNKPRWTSCLSLYHVQGSVAASSQHKPGWCTFPWNWYAAVSGTAQGGPASASMYVCLKKQKLTHLSVLARLGVGRP